MIELYTYPTPNGQKVQIVLEELELPYRTRIVDILAGEQFDEAFLRISPNNKIPAIVDPEGPGGEPLALFESGAILLYLSEKAGGALWPRSAAARHEAMAWLCFQVGHVGPMLGQLHHFRDYAPEPVPYARDRYQREAERLYGVVERRLRGRLYLLGDEFSLVDAAVFPWMRLARRQGVDLAALPAVSRWLDRVASRPAVERGLRVGRDVVPEHREMDERAREVLFGRGKDGGAT